MDEDNAGDRQQGAALAGTKVGARTAPVGGGWGLQIDMLIASSQPQDGQPGCEAARHSATTKGQRWLILQICSLSSIRRVFGAPSPACLPVW